MIDFEEFDIVVHDNGYFILPFKPSFDHGVAKPVGSFIKLLVGYLFVLENRCDFFRITPGINPQTVSQIHATS